MNDIERIDWWNKERLEEGVFTEPEQTAYDIISEQIEKCSMVGNWN